ncbi:cytochrome P450 [Nonomuraea dietziae]|uniref:Cytochrome P450 n=1 Tax=Nonomuraea dietziae TaxID=65515 RepID=A0A7W5VAR3_9ACTN|nr:cytochrome P450 [Nonomuraea dietziae]MBB3733812.1 cytochrome P450 [Nonomuraea dietziae]
MSTDHLPAHPNGAAFDLATGRASSTADLMPLSRITAAPDPAILYQRLRATWGEVARVELEPGVPAWLVMGWPEIAIIARNEAVYSRDARNWRDLREGVVAPDSGLGPMMFWRANVIGADGAEHRRLRAPLDDLVTRIDHRRLRRSVEAICADLVASFAARGHADLIAEYAAVIPMLAVASLFGLDTGKGFQLLAGLMALFGSGDDSQAGNASFEDILAAHMRTRRTAPADDLTSALINHPALYGDAEILQSIAVMVSAGYETTLIWIAQTLRLMLTDPRLAGRVNGGRLGTDEAMDEVLWRDPPMTHMPTRFALRDTELGDRYIRAGDALVLGLAAAGSDARIHTGERVMDLGNRSHLAWSIGPHACPARDPARLIARTAVETILNLLPGMKLAATTADIPLRPSPWTRCPAVLPVVFPPPPTPLRPARAARNP